MDSNYNGAYRLHLIVSLIYLTLKLILWLFVENFDLRVVLVVASKAVVVSVGLAATLLVAVVFVCNLFFSQPGESQALNFIYV